MGFIHVITERINATIDDEDDDNHDDDDDDDDDTVMDACRPWFVGKCRNRRHRETTIPAEV